MKRILISVLILSFPCLLLTQEIKVNQKSGIYQDRTEKHIKFHEFREFKPDLNQAIMSEITKIIVHNGNVFILDKRQSKIFVFNKQAEYLYSIGRPGQGPGDLEYPSDFIISREGEVHVLNTIAKRIEIFAGSGEFRRRIVIQPSADIFYAHPSSILINDRNEYIVAYSMCPNVIDIYDSEGIYIENMLKREESVILHKKNIGNCSYINFINGNGLLHFSHFDGVFIKTNLNRKITTKFSVYDSLINNKSEKIKKNLREKSEKGSLMVDIMSFVFWSNFCIDHEENIYIFPLILPKNEPQKLYVFSTNGTFLYYTKIPYFEGKRIGKIYCYDNEFIFVTMDEDIFFSKRGGKK